MHAILDDNDLYVDWVEHDANHGAFLPSSNSLINLSDFYFVWLMLFVMMIIRKVFSVMIIWQILRIFVEGQSRKNISEDNIEIKQPFIADDDDIYEMVAEDANSESDEDEDEDLFDSICAICDNGGDILWWVQSLIRLSSYMKIFSFLENLGSLMFS